jgi:hypothetical protein
MWSNCVNQNIISLRRHMQYMMYCVSLDDVGPHALINPLLWLGRIMPVAAAAAAAASCMHAGVLP